MKITNRTLSASTVITLLFGFLALMGCEDTITPRITEDVRLAGLPGYTLTIQQPAFGSVTPSGSLAVKQNEPLAIAVSLPSGGSYAFLGWQKISGSGTTAFGDVNALSTVVRLDGGDATIQPFVTDTPRALTVTNNGFGSTSPTGTVTVANGTPYQLHAYAFPTFIFQNWTKTGGAGIASWSDDTNKDATVTVTGDDVTIQANFRKENVGLTPRGSILLSDTTTYPEDGRDLHLYGGYLYVFGLQNDGSADSVIRRWNVSNPDSPLSGGNEYIYISGTARALIGDGTYLFTGTNGVGGDINRIAISGFNSLSTITKPTAAIPITDFGYYSGTPGYIWGITGSKVYEINKSTFVYGYYDITVEAGWTFRYLEKTGYGLLAVQESNGANRMGSYDVDAVSGASIWAAPDDYALLNTGEDMDGGDAGRIALHPDGDRVSVPVFNGDTTDYYLRNYFIDDPYGIGYSGQVALPDLGRYTAMGEYYSFVALGEAGGNAFIYVVDQSDWANPVVRTSYAVAGYEWVDSVALSADGNYLYAIKGRIADNKPTLQIYQIVRD